MSLDWGCKFFTPKNIADYVAATICDPKLVVDLFSGSGCLHQPILNKDFDVLAMDIDPSISLTKTSKADVNCLISDCLNPYNVKKAISEYSPVKTTIILNPPFRRIKAEREMYYWQEISKVSPKKLTNRIECLALASALVAAPINSEIIAIIPETLTRSDRVSFFFNALEKNYSLKILKTFKRARFGIAEVDIVIIKFKKNHNKQLVSLINESIPSSKNDKKIEIPFELFRGCIRNPNERATQTSVRDLRVGGVDIKGQKSLNESTGKKISKAGDILIARVGVRTIGRVGQIKSGNAYTNESILSLRINKPKERVFVYNILKSEQFTNWIKKEVRGTSNYFLPTNNLKKWIASELLKQQS